MEARLAAETARDAHFRAVMENSLQIVLANAARGLDPQVARQLLREVDEAIHLGKPIDMQALIDRRMADQDTETQERLNVRVLQARDDIVALRQSGQNDTVGLEGKLADAAMAVEARRLVQADALIDSVEHDVSATRESLRSTAAEILGQARGEVARAKADGIAVEAAAQMLTDAETSYSEARYGDTIYAGKACISEVEELASASLKAKRNPMRRSPGFGWSGRTGFIDGWRPCALKSQTCSPRTSISAERPTPSPRPNKPSDAAPWKRRSISSLRRRVSSKASGSR